MTEEAKARFHILRNLADGIDPDELDDVWTALPPATIEQVLGEWQGTSFQTGHSAIRLLDGMRWFGKSIRSRTDVDPVICLDEEGKLYCDREAAGQGGASLWMVEFRGTATATMVYDALPLLDHFKYVDESTLFGIMNGKEAAFDNGRHYYFVLDRVTT